MISLLWTLIVGLAHRGSVVHEREERGILALMLAPLPLSLVFLWVADWFPVSSASRIAIPWAEPTAAFGEAVEPVAQALVVPWSPLLLAAYALGLTWSLLRLARQRMRLLELEARARPFGVQDGIRVTEHPITPFVGPRGAVVVPAVLTDRLSEEQLRFVVEHERVHIARRDPQWFMGLALLDALFWFHPLVRRQTGRCRLAAELEVDAQVRDRGDPKLYARTLIDALKHTHGFQLSHVPAAARKGELCMRVGRVLRPPVVRRRGIRLAVATVGVFPLLAAQWSFVRASDGQPIFTVVPVEGRITSRFGHVPGPDRRMRNHIGVDIKARRGTRIYAPAAGTVIGVRRSKEKYGNLLTLDHGGGFTTRYAHLQSFDVNIGDRVSAGDVIGRVGNTGYSTGPHLHFELLREGKHVNPAALVPLPGKRQSVSESPGATR